MARKIEVEILGDSSSLERAFKRSSGAARRFNVGIGTLAKSAAVFGLVTGAATLMGKAIGTAVDEWKDQVRVAAQTNAVLKSTGGVANVSAKAVSGLAGQLSSLTGIDDEVIQAGENLLLTFKNVRNELGAGNNIFDRATKSAVDLSVAGFGSIATTSKQLGKALNDPIKGMTALGRAGVTFTADQKKTIKGLVDSGKLLQAQKIILKEVESQVGGSAKAYGRTLPGALSILRESVKNTFGGIVARIAAPLAKALQSVNGFVAGVSKARGIKAKFKVAIEGLENLGRRIFTQARDAVASVDWAEVIKTAQDGLLGGLRKMAEELDDVDWSEVGRRLGASIATGLQGAAAFLATVDWENVGQAVVKGIRRFLVAIDWKEVAERTIFVLQKALEAAGKLLLGVGKELAKALGDGLKAGLDRVQQGVEHQLLRLVNAVLGVTKFLGRFDPFRGVRERVQKQLKAMESDTRSAAATINSSLASIKDIDVTITIDTVATFNGQRRPEEGTSAQSIAQGHARKAISDDKARRGAANAAAAARARQKAADAATNAATKAAAASKSAAEKAAAKAKKIAEARDKAFASLMDSLSLKFDRATAGKNFKAALAVLADEEKAVRAQIAAAGRTTDLARQLFAITQERSSIQEQIREKAKAAADKAAAKSQVKQFRLLGLNAEGGEIIPGAENLRKQLASITARIAEAPGQVPAKLTNRLAGVRKLLSKSFKDMKEPTRAAIAELFAAIRGEFENQGKGPLTKTSALNTKKVIAGLGLSTDQAREIRGRLSSFNSAGIALAGKSAATGSFATGPIVVESHTTLNVDGHKMTSVVTRGQQKRKRRNPAQSRGPNRVSGV